MANLRGKYPYIVAWGHMMGSFDYYINDECERANADGAPSTAIYEESSPDNNVRHSHKWVTFDEVTSPSTLYEMKEHYLPAVGVKL